MEKRWIVKPPADKDLVGALSKELNMNLSLANILVQRGVTSFDEAKHFFRPSLEDLHDPFLMKDMDVAISRIFKAISNNEKILIYGDYDVDGTSAVALVYSFLKTHYENLAFYIPNRYTEGYGISMQGIDWAKEHGYTLIISLDCGIKSIDKIDYANSLDIDFIICDHHLPGNDLPKAAAVLDPKRSDCLYPYKELSGCGVGFKLIQAFAQKKGIDFAELEPYMDLVAVSIAADIVHITGENRVLTYFGMLWLNKMHRPGIKALIELSNFKKQLTVSDIVFTIGPRINAAGRIEDGKQAVELLIAANEEEASFAGKVVNEHNNERRTLDLAITEEALESIANNPEMAGRRSTVVYSESWHKGVIGIVASRLIEKYYRPTIVLTKSNGYVSGSARSVKDFDIYSAIESCSDLLDQFGGHRFAAGLTLKPENVEAFIHRFEEVVCANITESQLTQEIEIDVQLDLSQISNRFFSLLKQFSPFGPGNMAPVFVSRNVVNKGPARLVGSNHIKLNLLSASNKQALSIDAIGFQLGHYVELVNDRKPIDIAYTIEENEWNGQTSLQLKVKDIRLSEA